MQQDQKKLTIIAGPCAIESFEQMDTVAKQLSQIGKIILRGGAFKARTNPDSFQGMGLAGLKILKEIGQKYQMQTITEILDPRDLEQIQAHTDIIQIGARNMHNFELLKTVGKQPKPVLLKRSFSATIEEFLLAAKYITQAGNKQVILCERGIRTFEKATRNTLSLSAVPLIKELSDFPIIVDPTHATGKKSLIEPMSKAAIAAGADGLMIEVHPNPDQAKSDSYQQITPSQFTQIYQNLKPIAQAIGKEL